MKGTNLGEFEELVLLTVGILQSEAYSLQITKEINFKTKRRVAFGVVHSALNRLENKGFVTSKMSGATRERGGRRKRIYTVSTAGKKALVKTRKQREDLWKLMPASMFGKM